MLNVKVIVGSTRPGRFSEKILPWLHEELAKRGGMEVEVIAGHSTTQRSRLCGAREGSSPDTTRTTIGRIGAVLG